MLTLTLISRTLINKISLNKSTLNPITKYFIRYKSTKPSPSDLARNKSSRSTLYYAAAAGVLFIGFTYAAVPLYRMFCQVTLLVICVPILFLYFLC